MEVPACKCEVTTEGVIHICRPSEALYINPPAPPINFTANEFMQRKYAEAKACGCWWLYFAAQPVVAPCPTHLAKLEQGEG